MKILPRAYAECLIALAKGKTHQQIEVLIREFISFLARQGLLLMGTAVLRSLRDTVCRSEGLIRVTIATAHGVDSHDRKMFEEMIHASYGKKSSITFVVDEELIGGFRINADDLVVDASDAGYLHALRRHLQKSTHGLRT